MRSLFLILLLANLLVLAAQFEPVRELLWQDASPGPRTWLNPEKLRIIRDTSRPARTAAVSPAVDQPVSGTKN